MILARDHRSLHPFPTRRSSDLIYIPLPCYHSFPGVVGLGRCLIGGSTITLADKFSATKFWHDCRVNKCTVNAPGPRSEEHTSELQSRGHLVCRHLLEKNKIMKT